MLPIRAETTVSTYGSVEITRLKKKKMNNLAVLTNSSSVLPRLLLTVRYPQSLTTVVLAEFSRLL